MYYAIIRKILDSHKVYSYHYKYGWLLAILMAWTLRSPVKEKNQWEKRKIHCLQQGSLSMA